MIAFEISVTDLSKEVGPRYEQAARDGIAVAGQYLKGQLFRAYNSYYTTREHKSTLQIRQAIKYADPERAADGWYTMVGVPSAQVKAPGAKKSVDRGMVALYWELGWSPKGSPVTYRYPLAVPTATRVSQQIVDAFARTVKRHMEKK